MKKKNIIILITLLIFVCSIVFACYFSKHITKIKEPTTEEIQEPLKTYLNAIYLFSNNELEKSYEQFNKIIDYENSSEYLQKIKQLKELNILGLWYNWFNSDIGLYIDFTPTTCYMYIKEKDKTINSQAPLSFDDKTFKCGDYNFIPTTQKYVANSKIDENGNWVVTDYEERKEYIVQYNSYNEKNIFNGRQFTKSKQFLSYEPQLNMTKDKVVSSSWEKPKEIITTTYSQGTKEQWVYARGNIYFENGIVTSISER